jgi:hypothetical protein
MSETYENVYLINLLGTLCLLTETEKSASLPSEAT